MAEQAQRRSVSTRPDTFSSSPPRRRSVSGRCGAFSSSRSRRLAAQLEGTSGARGSRSHGSVLPRSVCGLRSSRTWARRASTRSLRPAPPALCACRRLLRPPSLCPPLQVRLPPPPGRVAGGRQSRASSRSPTGAAPTTVHC
jgi:hypothetical protein